MNDQFPVLCVGGPLDGKRFVVRDLRPTLEFAKPPKDHSLLQAAADNKWQPVVYERIKFRGNTREFFVYCPQGYSADTAMELLLDNYLIPKTTRS